MGARGVKTLAYSNSIGDERGVLLNDDGRFGEDGYCIVSNLFFAVMLARAPRLRRPPAAEARVLPVPQLGIDCLEFPL